MSSISGGRGVPDSWCYFVVVSTGKLKQQVQVLTSKNVLFWSKGQCVWIQIRIMLPE